MKPTTHPNLTKTRRGQSSTEYLLTYAWALLLATALLGMIYYLGWFNTLATPSYTATGFTNIEMYSFISYKNGTTLLQLRNQVETPITIRNVTVDNVLVTANFPQTINSGSITTVTILNAAFGPATNSRYTKKLVFNYILQGGTITHYESGQISDKVY